MFAFYTRRWRLLSFLGMELEGFYDTAYMYTQKFSQERRLCSFLSAIPPSDLVLFRQTYLSDPSIACVEQEVVDIVHSVSAKRSRCALYATAST